ncbi:MAG: hypothetical protein K6G85_08595 [Eubacterium sp.]|nr:hypothetical protein [Eubacterium sp.]
MTKKRKYKRSLVLQVAILIPIAVVTGISHFFIFDRFGSNLIYMSNLGE